MHGLFLNPSAANALLSYLHSRKGLVYEPFSAAAPILMTSLPIFSRSTSIWMRL